MKVAWKIKIHIPLRITFSENHAVCEVMWKNMVQADKPQMTIQHGECALHAD